MMEELNLDKYRKKLIIEKNKLRKDIDELDASLDFNGDANAAGELSDYDQHPADDATNTFEKEKDISIRDAWRQTLLTINHAIDKIDDGTYGKCDRCGADISKERLNILPYAIYCVNCQNIIEGR